MSDGRHVDAEERREGRGGLRRQQRAQAARHGFAVRLRAGLCFRACAIKHAQGWRHGLGRGELARDPLLRPVDQRRAGLIQCVEHMDLVGVNLRERPQQRGTAARMGGQDETTATKVVTGLATYAHECVVDQRGQCAWLQQCGEIVAVGIPARLVAGVAAARQDAEDRATCAAEIEAADRLLVGWQAHAGLLSRVSVEVDNDIDGTGRIDVRPSQHEIRCGAPVALQERMVFDDQTLRLRRLRRRWRGFRRGGRGGLAFQHGRAMLGDLHHRRLAAGVLRVLPQASTCRERRHG